MTAGLESAQPGAACWEPDKKKKSTSLAWSTILFFLFFLQELSHDSMRGLSTTTANQKQNVRP